MTGDTALESTDRPNGSSESLPATGMEPPLAPVRRVLAALVCVLGVPFMIRMQDLVGQATRDGWAGVRGAYGALAIAILLAALILGRKGVRAAWGRTPSVSELHLGVPVGLGTIVVSATYGNFLWWAQLLSFKPPGTGYYDPDYGATLWIFWLILVPALFEELLFRGLLWVALPGNRTRILITAALFAAMHATSDPHLETLPHRFVSGLVYGWLRLRTGGIAVPMVAHATHNGVLDANSELGFWLPFD